MVAKKKATTGRSSPYLTSTDVDELSPTNRMAHEILTSRGDLLPSIDRIMRAGLSDSDTIAALTFFRDALGVPGDPNRDPRVAIATATGDGPAT
jgi:hypothetical protein